MTEAQIITDVIMRNYAKWQKITLSEKYYLEPELRNYYKIQILKANSLLKIYDYADILLAIKELEYICSLNNKSLIDKLQVIKKRREKLAKSKQIVEELSETKEVVFEPKLNTKKGRLGKLDV